MDTCTNNGTTGGPDGLGGASGTSGSGSYPDSMPIPTIDETTIYSSTEHVFTIPGDTLMPHVIETLGGLSQFKAALKQSVSLLFDEHGLSEWVLIFDNGVNRAGLCNYSKKQVSISTHFVQSRFITYQEMFNVVYHEIAHAITPGHGHDKIWRDTAIRLGGDGNRHCKAFVQHAFVGSCKCTNLCHYRHKVRPSKPPRCASCLDLIAFTAISNRV